ncbi:hypothetical protein [Desulfofundulus thermobenzoicus]|nr:hypothetical protein [Desulfofundulus thermobenzoicus]
MEKRRAASRHLAQAEGVFAPERRTVQSPNPWQPDQAAVAVA